jgi:hypothetical protein
MDVSRSDLARSGQSGYLPNADVSTVPQALRFMPVGVLYFVTVPWPWQVGSARQNITLPETAFWVLILYPLMGLGVVQALRRNFQGSSLLVIMGLAICSFYALLVGNIGTAYRLRIQVWLLGAVFAGLGWQRWKELRAQRPVRVARRPARGNRPLTGAR